MERELVTVGRGRAPRLAELVDAQPGSSSSPPGARPSWSRGAPCRPIAGGSARPEVACSANAQPCVRRGLAGPESAAMASSGVGVSAAGAPNEAPEIPDNVGDWLRGVYRFATDRNDFRR